MIDKYELIEILETLQNTGDIQFKESNKVDMVERYLKSRDGENGVLPLVSNSVCTCTQPCIQTPKINNKYICSQCNKPLDGQTDC